MKRLDRLVERCHLPGQFIHRAGDRFYWASDGNELTKSSFAILVRANLIMPVQKDLLGDWMQWRPTRAGQTPA